MDLHEHRANIERDGFTILERVIPPALVDAIASELASIEVSERIVPTLNPFEGDKTVRIYNLLARGRVFEQIPVHDAVLPLVEKVLDKGCLVSSLSSIGIDPGQTAQPMHADDQLIPLPRPHVPIVCNTMWAITDFTEENGATVVVPGSHKADKPPEPWQRCEGAVAAVMPKGSVLVYNGSLWHGGGENKSAARRMGVAMNYCAGWVRQQENQQLGIPLQVAKGFSERLRKLCGFGLYRGLIGHIDKCSPVDLLDGTGPRRVVGVLG